ncbi:MAG: DUF6094 domain-containing protein [Tissierellales bacterium]|jgi:hypothetical protein|nr:DUF6094 domain-containing protein [Tissierellales bacterium]
MHNVKELTNRFSRTVENESKMGFYPTDPEIVRMEMELINFEVTDIDKVSICDFSAGDGLQLYQMREFIKNKSLTPFSYLNEFAKSRYEEAIEKYSEEENFFFCNSDIFTLKCRSKQGRRYETKTMAIVRNNPPYGFTKRYEERIRTEELFFLENDKYLVEGGIHILEVPINTLAHYPGLMKKITFRYENINIYKFPEKVFKKFGQIVLIGTKKSKNCSDIELAEYWVEKLKIGDILSLDQVNGPVVSLSGSSLKKAKEVNVFRDGKIDDISLSKGLFSELDNLLAKEKEMNSYGSIKVIQDETAIIERSVGHRALELASGKFNKICGDVLIYGFSEKKVRTNVDNEDNKEITTETEYLVSGIEITNKNGNVIRKESIN